MIPDLDNFPWPTKMKDFLSPRLGNRLLNYLYIYFAVNENENITKTNYNEGFFANENENENFQIYKTKTKLKLNFFSGGFNKKKILRMKKIIIKNETESWSVVIGN